MRLHERPTRSFFDGLRVRWIDAGRVPRGGPRRAPQRLRSDETRRRTERSQGPPFGTAPPNEREFRMESATQENERGHLDPGEAPAERAGPSIHRPMGHAVLRPGRG